MKINQLASATAVETLRFCEEQDLLPGGAGFWLGAGAASWLRLVRQLDSSTEGRSRLPSRGLEGLEVLGEVSEIGFGHRPPGHVVG